MVYHKPLITRFAGPTRPGLRDHAFKIHQQRCKTQHRQHAFSARVVSYWIKLPDGIVNALAVEIFKALLGTRWQSLSLKCPSNPSSHILPELLPPCRIRSIYHFPMPLVVQRNFYCPQANKCNLNWITAFLSPDTTFLRFSMLPNLFIHHFPFLYSKKPGLPWTIPPYDYFCEFATLMIFCDC